MEIYYKIFNSSKELADFCVNQPKVYREYSSDNDLTRKSEEKLRFGDQIIVEALKAPLKTFGYKKTISYDFAGQKPIVQRAVQSNPYAFQNVKKQYKENKFVTIIFDQTVPWHYSASKMTENGKKVLATLKYMEQNGYRIKLLACAGASINRRSDSKANMLLLKLKDYHEPFSLSRISFPIANAEFLRNVFFSWTDRDPNCCDLGSNYGYALGLDHNDITLGHQMSSLLGTACVYVTNFTAEKDNFVEKLIENSEKLLQLGHKTGKKY